MPGDYTVLFTAVVVLNDLTTGSVTFRILGG